MPWIQKKKSQIFNLTELLGNRVKKSHVGMKYYPQKKATLITVQLYIKKESLVNLRVEKGLSNNMCILYTQ